MAGPSIGSTVVDTLPGQGTLLAAWRALARISPRARVLHTPTAAAAVFPAWTPLNNAIAMTTDSVPAAVVTDLRTIYADAGIGRWALWVPTRATDLDAADEQVIPGLERDTTTLVMRMSIPEGLPRHDGIVRTSIATATRATDEPVPVSDLCHPERVAGLTGWVIVREGLAVTGAWSYLHGDDCGIYAVGTSPAWQRQGFARSLLGHVLADAHRRGARTASLQSTRAGQRLYEALGFEAVGRYEEWVSG